MYKQEFIRRALQLIEKLMKDERAYAFIDPVDKKEYPRYYQMISHPTHLELIKKHLTNKYAIDYRMADFEEELDRLWENCFRFNQKRSQIFISGKQLQRETRKELQKIRKDIIEKIFNKRDQMTKPSLISLFRFGKFLMGLDEMIQKLLMEAISLVNPEAISRVKKRILLGRLSEQQLEGLMEYQKL